MGIPDHLTCLLRNLYAGQETALRTRHGTTDWFQIEKGLCQCCILSPCLFNLYAEYIISNAGLDEAHAGIKIAERNINNLRYADDTILRAESEEELKSLLMKVKEEREKAGLKQRSKNNDHGIQSHHFMANRWGNNGNSDRIANIHWIIEKQENSRKASTSASLTTLKPLTVWITINCGKF